MAPAWAPRLTVTAVGAVTFALAVWAGRQTVVPGTDLSLIWPAAGVAAVWFAAQRRSRRIVPDVVVLIAITLVINVCTGASPPLAVGFVVANLMQLAVLGYMLGSGAPRIWGAGGTAPLTRVREFGVLMGAAGAASLVGAVVGPTAVGLVTGTWSATDYLLWTTRNAASILLLLSAAMLLRPRIASVRQHGAAVLATALRPTALAELIALLAASAVLYVGVFGVFDGLPLAFPLLVVTIWVALRFDSAVASLHGVALAVVAVLFTLAHHGPFAGVADDEARAIVVQLFIGMVATVGMILALSRDERDALLRRVRRQAAESRVHAEQSGVLARVSAEIFGADEPRPVVCRAAAEIAGADGAYLFEPDGAGALVPVAVTGADVPPVTVPLAGEPSITATTFLDGNQRFVPDIAGDPRSHPRVVAALRAESGLWQPVLMHGKNRSVGVMVVFWRRRVHELPAHAPAMLATLAAEAAAALERSDLLARLADAAERDFLTGLRNRRSWDEHSTAEVARATRTGRPLTFVILDLDHFKRYNDTLGHKAGDLLLREFAAAATSCLREIDILARWGGEEFVICLPDCPLPEAVQVAERLRQTVPRGQTCTIGLAAWSPGQTADQVLATADAALYRGKAAGRNRVEVGVDTDAPDLPGQTVATEPESTR